jgi:hypothetical protein
MTTEVTIAEVTPSEEVAPTASEVIAADTIEATAEAAVTVAAIEADRDIELATIAAETEIARTEIVHADRTASLELELSQCQTEMEALRAENIELRATLSTLPPSTPEPLEPSPPPASDASEVTPVSPEEQREPAPEPRRKEPAFRWI